MKTSYIHNGIALSPGKSGGVWSEFFKQQLPDISGTSKSMSPLLFSVMSSSVMTLPCAFYGTCSRASLTGKSGKLDVSTTSSISPPRLDNSRNKYGINRVKLYLKVEWRWQHHLSMGQMTFNKVRSKWRRDFGDSLVVTQIIGSKLEVREAPPKAP